MKKRILISAHYLELGGAETSLIGLLHAIDYSLYEVDLFLQSVRGELLQYVPREVNIIPEIASYSMIEKPITECICKGHWNVAFRRLLAKYHHGRYMKRTNAKDAVAVYGFINKYVTPAFHSLKDRGTYDLAINYISLPDIVLDKIDAKKKVTWIHTDYSTVDVNPEIERSGWERYDKIISISPDVTKAFLKSFSGLEGKIVECENIMPKELIEQKVSDVSGISEGFKVEEGVVTILSVGRICEAKNYDNIPYMAKALKELFNEKPPLNLPLNGETSNLPFLQERGGERLPFHWYIIGPGDHSAIDELSKQLGVDDVVTFLGPSSNPYPYIKACDIYVHPSRYEGKSIVVREAQMLCKPVVVTNYPTASSQIQDGVDGVIVPMDNEGCAKGLAEFVLDVEKQNKIIDYLKIHDYGNVDEVNKIYNLL